MHCTENKLCLENSFKLCVEQKDKVVFGQKFKLCIEQKNKLYLENSLYYVSNGKISCV